MKQIKVAGHWKDVTDRFINVGGKWLPTLATFIKINGKWQNINNIVVAQPAFDYYYDLKTPTISSTGVWEVLNQGTILNVVGKINACNHLYLGKGQSIDYPIVDGFSVYYDSTLKDFIQTTTTAGTFTMTKSHQVFFNCTKALTANELAQLKAQPNLIVDVWFNGKVLQDGFKKSDIGNFMMPVEGTIGTVTVKDLSTNAQDSTIMGYTATCRTSMANTNEGINNLFIKQDSSGIPTGVSVTMVGGTDGRNIGYGTKKYDITKCITALKVKGATVTTDDCRNNIMWSIEYSGGNLYGFRKNDFGGLTDG